MIRYEINFIDNKDSNNVIDKNILISKKLLKIPDIILKQDNKKFSDKEIKENAKSILWIPRKKGSRDPKEGVDQPLYEYSEMILGPLYNESWTRGGQFIL